MNSIQQVIPELTLPLERCLVIGEVAQAHDGSLGTAHAYIDAIAETGADAVKFQTHIASAESTPGEPWRVKFSRQDSSRYEYWQRMEFTESQWEGLKSHADERGLIFLSSPFSDEAVNLLRRLRVSAWKVASGELTNFALLDKMMEDGRPILLSTGMGLVAEVNETVARIRRREVQFAVMQCTSAYPTPPEEVGINLLNEYRNAYQCPVGLSDHSGTIYPALAAVNRGAEIIEVHVTLSREMFGPDVCASVTTAELKELVRGIRFTETMLAHPVQKDRMADKLKSLRGMFTKSVVARNNLPAGTVLKREDLTVKKPGGGIAPAQLESLISRRLESPVERDEMISEGHFS